MEFPSFCRYQAALRSRMTYRLLRGPALRIPQPTLVIWGEKDPYLDARCNETLHRYVPDLQIKLLKDANH